MGYVRSTARQRLHHKDFVTRVELVGQSDAVAYQGLIDEDRHVFAHHALLVEHIAPDARVLSEVLVEGVVQGFGRDPGVRAVEIPGQVRRKTQYERQGSTGIGRDATEYRTARGSAFKGHLDAALSSAGFHRSDFVFQLGNALLSDGFVHVSVGFDGFQFTEQVKNAYVLELFVIRWFEA